MIPDKGFIKEELASSGLCPCIHTFETVDSTNNVARELAAEADEDILVISSEQTAGKGTHGRSFFSPDSTGLYFSAVFSGLSVSHPVTFAAGVASVKALRHLGIETSMKWVNDIITDGRKAGGILCERLSSGKVIIGIGINLSAPRSGFPDEIKATAAELGLSPEVRDILAVHLYRELAEAVRSEPVAVLDAYRAVCGTIGRHITFDGIGGRAGGTALAVDDDGALLVRTDSGEDVRLESGFVSVRYE